MVSYQGIRVRTSCYRSAALVPSCPAPADPFTTRAWATAWENVTTEPILESRCLDVTAAGTQVTTPFHLVKASPLWTAYEAAARGRVVRMLDGHEVPVRGSLKAFQAAISVRHRRKEFGREWRRGTDSGLRLRVLPGTGMRDLLGPFTRLAAAAAAKHDVPWMYGADLSGPP